ncbi:hypothetical protein MRB53_026086 [Persea americana]|uniref:Uncharacterized protein n=1 Tax=Persea americana TaxID=3435 RepID=A0ACC2LHL0_PERAE|nr:hypothetical protein MRB53_026086 [Persea americana]
MTYHISLSNSLHRSLQSEWVESDTTFVDAPNKAEKFAQREWVESDTTFVDAPNKAEKFAQRSFTLPFTFYCYLYNKLKASYVLNVILSKSDFVLASQLRNYNFIHYDKII